MLRQELQFVGLRKVPASQALAFGLVLCLAGLAGCSSTQPGGLPIRGPQLLPYRHVNAAAHRYANIRPHRHTRANAYASGRAASGRPSGRTGLF